MSQILDKVNLPEDLKGLTYTELEVLAEELREEIVKTISLNGGHLASSLGAIELTIALHRVFNCPQDKIVWDVGHQAYAHKLLTGRKERFSTIRQLGGLSGFPSRKESPYDAFTAGHAGTSISAAMGMALARDLSKANYQVAAVFGDGSLGNGLALEAINHAGQLKTKMLLILNDNGMAISPTMGAVSHLLNRVRTASSYERAKGRFSRMMKKMPLGRMALSLSKRAKSQLESVLLPSAFWEQMGFIYLGPLNGHDIREIESALKRARDFETKPVVLHVLTIKGKGYSAAEDNAVKFHGLSPSTATKDNSHSSYSQIFGQTMQKLMRENEKIVAISAAMLDGTGLSQLQTEFPKRVIDVGICEEHAVTLAGGLAAAGYLPVVAVYSTFLQRSYDQIIHDICLPNLPVIFAVDRAGIVGEDGATHQGSFDISFMNTIPNLIVSAPKDEDELRHMLFTAVKAGRPMSIRYPRGSGEGVALSQELQLLQIGKCETLRMGRDLTIIALGSMVYPALDAAKRLADKGIYAAVINARFMKPLDKDSILKMAIDSGHVLTIEENTLAGGLGSSVAAIIAQTNTRCHLECMGIPDCFVEHGDPEQLRAIYGLNSEGICERVFASFPQLIKPAVNTQSG
jgi:1-deoxy-D-xylulose-5-phosphate synthase